MKFYNACFMDVGSEISLNVHVREGSTWIALADSPDAVQGVVTLHIRAGHEDRIRAACAAFNAALAAPVAIAAE